MNDKEKWRMIEGLYQYSTLTPRPLNKEIIEYILRRRFAHGASVRGRLQIIIGIFTIVLLTGCLILAPGIPMIIMWILLGGVVGGLFIWCGTSNIRNCKPNEQKIVNGSYCLKETFVTKYREIFDSEALDSHIFTFTDGEEESASSGINCDSVFYYHGKVGDRCLLLFFEGYDKPTYVFDTRWWTLQPELECFVQRQQIKQPDLQATADQWKSQW